jgi:hypothetical protein
MGDASQFFVVAFERTEARDVRIDAVIKASSEHNAVTLASHFADRAQGVVAYARLTDPGAAAEEKVELLAKFGDPLPDGSSVWALGESRGSETARGISPLMRSLRTRLRAVMNPHFLWEGVVIPRALAMLVAVALGVSGGSLVASADARVARLMEIVRPVCLHPGIQNKDLRRIVRHKLRAGSSTEDIVHAITSACQAIS